MRKINTNSINNYWDKYYQKTTFDKQSNFANFVLRKLKNKKNFKLADIACGNGRDTVFFYHKGLKVIGFDQSKIVIKNNIKKFGNFFLKVNFCKKNLNLKLKFDIFYIRFFSNLLITGQATTVMLFIILIGFVFIFICLILSLSTTSNFTDIDQENIYKRYTDKLEKII